MAKRSTIDGFSDFRDFVSFAERLLLDFADASDQVRHRDLMVAFAATITTAGEFAFPHVRGDPMWSEYQTGPAFKAWLSKREPALGQFETIAVSWRHTRLTTHQPTITHTDVTTGEVTTIATLDNLVMLSDALEGAIVGSVEINETTEPPAVTLRYTAQKIFGESNTTWFYPAAKRAIKFWLSFDPRRGPSQ